jgi:hypothetical protein
MVVAILDSHWGLGSNGRMEREYIEGITGALAGAKPK